MTIKNLKEAEAALRPFVPLVKQLTGKDTTLARIRPLMKLLGNPQDQLKIIHIAGTSGKTSTAYYMAALLQAAGQQVGLTVSPHVDSVTERVQLNGQPLSEAEFCAQLGDFLDIVERAEQQPSYFELLYAFAIWVFARQGVDYAVVETGMGGLYDATNVTTRPDKVCIITDIGLDHQHILGKTLPEIAAQKVGIVHDRNQVFMYRQPAAVQTVIEGWVKQHHATMRVADVPAQSKSELPAYQWRNWQLAYKVYEYLRRRDKLPRLTSQVLAQTRQINVPGRMEIRRLGGKTLIMDGAHNAQKMTAFIDSFQRLYPGVKPAILLSLKTGKEYREVARLLVPLASRVIATTFNTTQDLPVVSIDPIVLAETFKAAGSNNVETITDQQAAFKALLSGPEEVCIVTGSFYLLSQIRNNKSLA